MKKSVLLFMSLIFGVLTSFCFAFYMHPGSNNRIYTGFVILIPFVVFFYNFFMCITNKHISLKEIIFCSIFGIVFLYALLSKANYIVINKASVKLFIYMTLVMLMVASIIYAFVCLKSIHWSVNNKQIGRKIIIIYALPSIVVWSIYLIGFYPGVMTADSMSQWKQILTKNFEDWHPFMHTLFNLIVTRVWNSPAAISIAQIIIISITFGYGMYCLEKNGVKRNIIYILIALFAINPVNGIMSITLWKDVLYSNFIVLHTILIVNIVLSNGIWLRSNRNKMFFILSSLGVLFFRHNGIIPFLGTMIVMFYLYKENRILLVKITLSILGIYVLIRGPIYSLVGVKPGSSNEALGIPTQQIAAVVTNNGYLTEEQKNTINEIMPLKYWSENYVPCNVDYIKFNENFKSDAISKNKAKFLKLWINICLQNPKTAIGAYLDQTTIIWSVKEHWPTNGGTRTITENRFGIKQIVVSDKIKYITNKALNATLIKDIRFMFWRPALQLYMIIFIGAISAARNGKKVLLMISPIIFNNLSLAIAIPAQDFRYLYSNSLIFCILIVALFVNFKDNSNISGRNWVE